MHLMFWRGLLPSIEDGLKPVQRRIITACLPGWMMEFHKVANIIGRTMQFPHGDASIGDALVNLGQKDLLIDTQGSWGDVDREILRIRGYIEARLQICWKWLSIHRPQNGNNLMMGK
ncbi:MAG: DNA gyrase subunit A [Saprospiraceae bacterium]